MQKFTIFEKPIVKAFPVCYTTHDTKAGPSLTSDGYRNRTDTGGGRPCFYMRDLYLGERTRTGEYHGTSKGTGPADISVDSSADHCRFFIGYYDFLGITGYGFIPLVIMNATILHIPTIIGSLSAGRKVGMIVGFMFGIFSFIRSLQAPSALLLFAVQYNVIADAFICIVPRILIGLIAYELYRHLKTREVVRVAVTAVVTTVIHTVLFLGSFTALVGVPYAEAQGIPFMNVINIMLGITAVNGIPEAVVSGLIVTPIVMALQRAGLKA